MVSQPASQSVYNPVVQMFFPAGPCLYKEIVANASGTHVTHRGAKMCVCNKSVSPDDLSVDKLLLIAPVKWWIHTCQPPLPVNL
jgi:hypothetical protein